MSSGNPLLPGTFYKANVVDLQGFKSQPDVPIIGNARLYYNSQTNAVHCIDSNGTELFSFSGTVISVFGRGGSVIALNSDYSAFYLQLAPAANQTILGPHQLINRGTDQTGFPFTSFSPDIQGFAINPASGDVAISGQTSGPGNAGVQGIQTGGGQGIGVFGLGEATNDATFGGFFATFANVTSGNAYVGTAQFGQINLTVTGSIAQDVGANAGEAKIYGGTVRSLSSYITAGNQDNAGGTGGIATNSYGYNVQQAMSLGTPSATINAAFHANDQGAGAGNYGILLEGVTHNKLGGGYTQVGALAVPSASASTTSNIAVTSGIVEATGGVAGITLSTQSASLVNGQIVTVKKVDSGAGAVTLTDLAAANFDGDSSYVLSDQWQYVTVQWNGSRFNVIGNN